MHSFRCSFKWYAPFCSVCCTLKPFFGGSWLAVESLPPISSRVLKGNIASKMQQTIWKGKEKWTFVWLFVPFSLTYFSVGQVESQPCTGLWQQLRTDQTPHCVHSRESTFNLENKLGLYVGLRGHTMTVIWGPFRLPPHCVQRVHDDRTFGVFFYPSPRRLWW